MRITISPLSADTAAEIVAWRYEGVYAFYDLDADPHDLAEFLDPATWGVSYFAAHDERGDLIGFFYILLDAGASTLTIGLGMRPDLTGRGLGQGFLEAGLEWARERYDPATFRLTVAAFNARAMRVYERAGFRPTRRFMHHTNGGEWEFIEMVRSSGLLGRNGISVAVDDL